MLFAGNLLRIIEITFVLVVTIIFAKSKKGRNNMSAKKGTRVITKEVRELLAVIGERLLDNKVPIFEKSWDPETKQNVYSIPGEDRKLVVDPDGEINWFDAVNGPVGV